MIHNNVLIERLCLFDTDSPHKYIDRNTVKDEFHLVSEGMKKTNK